MDRHRDSYGSAHPATIDLMIRFVRILFGIVAAAAAVAWVQRALGLEGFAGAPGEAFFTAIALLLASLADREFFYGTPPKHRR